MSKNVSDIKQENDHNIDDNNGDDKMKIDTIKHFQQIILEKLNSLKLTTTKNQSNENQNQNKQIPELGKKFLQLLLQTINDDDDDENDDSEDFIDEKLEILNNFVKTFIDFNKDSFVINFNDNDDDNNGDDDDVENIDDEDDDDDVDGMDSKSDNTSITESDNNEEELIERMNTRSTSKLQQQQQQQSTSKKCKKQKKIKQNRRSLSSKMIKQIKTKQSFIMKSSTNKFLIDCNSSLILKLNTSLYDPTFPLMYAISFNQFCYPDNVFAVCGQSIVVVYRCLSLNDNDNDNGLQPLFAHTDRNDSYYCCCWSYDQKRPDHSLLCIAGERGVIRIIDVKKQCETKTFYGHGAAINDLKICPNDPTLLLSASKDSGIRLWNIATNTLIAIFGGVQGHRDEVLAIDFHRSRSLFVSVSIDHSIKIWSFCHHEVAQAIQLSRTFQPDQNAQQFSTVSQHFPNYSTRDVHHNYIDSVQWFGDLLITKSCDEKLIIWKPGLANETLDDIEKRTYYSDFATHNGLLDSNNNDSSTINVIIIKHFNLDRNNIWFVRFSFDLNEFLLAIGNLQGHLFIYDFKHFNPNNYCLSIELPVPLIFNNKKQQQHKNKKLPQHVYSRCIRQTSFNFDGTILIVLCENSNIIRYDLLRLTKPMILSYLQSTLLNN